MNLSSRTSIRLLLLIFIAFGIYVNSLGGDFVWDDSGLIAGNAEYLEDVSNLPSAFLKPQFDETPYYRPLLWASFFFDYYIGKTSPRGFHVTNVLLHVSNTLLVYWFITALGFTASVSFLTAGLFVAHPVQTEAIAWIAGRNDPLMVLFLLLAFIFLLKARQSKSSSRKTAWYVCVLGSFSCALLTKETALVFLPLLLLIDLFYQKQVWHPSLRRETGAVYIMVFLTTLGFLMLRKVVFTELPARLSFQLDNIAQGLATPVSIYSYYFKVLFFPFNLTVAPSLGNDPGINSSTVLFALFLAGSVIAAVLLRRVFKEFLFGILWILIYLIPVGGLVWMGVPILEHRLYGASIGFCLMLAAPAYNCTSCLAAAAPQHKRKLWYGIVICIVIAYSFLSVNRNRIWENDVAVWSDTLRKSPDSVTALNNIGAALIKDKLYDRALACLDRAVQLNPKSDKIYGNQGLAFSRKKDYPQALSAYEKVLQLNPRSIETYNNMGMVYKEMGDYGRALMYIQKSLELNPRFARGYMNRALLHEHQGNNAQALADYQTALQLTPHNSSLHNALGLLYAQEGKFEKALEQYQRAVSLDASNYESLNNTALVYIRQHDYPKALPFLNKAIAVQPGSPELHLNLGIVFFNTGKINEAIGEYTKALSINPDYIEAHFNIATALLLMPDKRDQALYHFRQVLILKPDYKQKDLIEKTIAAISIQRK